MRLYRYFVICFCLGIIFGCENMVEDLEENKLPHIESKLAVESYISPQSEQIIVRVTASQPLFGPSTFEPVTIKNATVTLSGETASIRIPYIDSTDSYIIPASKFKIEAGKKYTLVVDDGKRVVKASCVVPAKKAVVKSYVIDTIPGPLFSTDTVARVQLSWDDIKGETNYYTVRGFSVTEQTYPGYIPETGGSGPVRGDNKSRLEIDSDYLVNDINLDGITFNAPIFNIYLPKHFMFQYVDASGKLATAYSNPKFKEIYVEILNLDINYYKFHRSLKDIQNNDNPFVEPTLVYTNIEGGLGCFGAYNVGSLSIKP